VLGLGQGFSSRAPSPCLSQLRQLESTSAFEAAPTSNCRCTTFVLLGLGGHDIFDGGQLVGQRRHIKCGCDHISGQSQIGCLQLPALKVRLGAQLFQLAARSTENIEPIRDVD